MLPLNGRRILITRSRHQASELALRVEALGGASILIPTIEMVAPESFDGLDDALGSLTEFDWVLFTSANAVTVFCERAAKISGGPASMPKVGVIGGGTARVARENGLRVDLVPVVAVAEALAAEMLLRIGVASKVLIVRAAVARDHIVDALRAVGAEVTVAEAYRTVAPADSVAMLREMFGVARHWPDAITFTSSSTAGNLMQLMAAAGVTLPQSVVRASIGPITSATLRELGMAAVVEAREATVASLAEALAEYFSAASSPRL